MPDLTIRPTRSVQEATAQTAVRLLAGLAMLAVFAVISLLAVRAAAEPVPPPSGDLEDAPTLERFFDDNVAREMGANDIPGATISVVKDGKLLFAKGYGSGDIASSRPVVASETLFRIGSVTKLFTWTAVMQLVEAGQLDLNADVNTYLESLTIPDTYPQPITMAHLMTHTAGFEERQLGLSVIEKERARPLATVLAADMPDRIYPPGEVTAYSNYGAALAGYIVEQISSEPFDEYVQRHILEPLAMRHSTAHQDLSHSLAKNLASSYQSVNGTLEPLPREYFELLPAAGMSATATDMAHFMIAHLRDGQFAERRILKPTTVQDMHRQHFTNDPRLSGMALGFVEQRQGDQRILMHAGSTNSEQFQSYLMLVPGEGTGLFVSFNSEGGRLAKGLLAKSFLDRYFPQPPPQQSPGVKGYKQRAARFEGSFQATRRTESNIEKLAGLIPSAVKVSANADGTLAIVGGPMGTEARRWLEVEPRLFREVGGMEEVAFAEDTNGNVTSMFADHSPIVAFTKQHWWETSTFHLGLLAGSIFIFLTAVVGLPIAGLRGWRRRAHATRGAHLTRGLAWLASLLFILFAVLLVTGLADLEEGISPLAKAALNVGLAGAGVAAALAISTAFAWKNRYWGPVARLYTTVVALTGLVFIWFLNYWNVLGLRL
jgi:CubicO group peptidase (beta-lactamase class C family)